MGERKKLVGKAGKDLDSPREPEKICRLLILSLAHTMKNMNYSTIKNPPKNESSYIKTPPENLMALLQQGVARIVTSCPIGSVSDAISFSNSKGYQVSMIRWNDPSDVGGIMSMTGTFYFQCNDE